MVSGKNKMTDYVVYVCYIYLKFTVKQYCVFMDMYLVMVHKRVGGNRSTVKIMVLFWGRRRAMEWERYPQQ